MIEGGHDQSYEGRAETVTESVMIEGGHDQSYEGSVDSCTGEVNSVVWCQSIGSTTDGGRCGCRTLRAQPGGLFSGSSCKGAWDWGRDTRCSVGRLGRTAGVRGCRGRGGRLRETSHGVFFPRPWGRKSRGFIAGRSARNWPAGTTGTTLGGGCTQLDLPPCFPACWRR